MGPALVVPLRRGFALSVPGHIADPLERLQWVHQRTVNSKAMTDALKELLVGMVTF